MIELTNNEMLQLWDDIHTNNAVLFLGQHYQEVYNGNNVFISTINSKICGSKISTPNYPSLWKYMVKKSDGKKLSRSQKESINEIANMTPKMEKLADTLSIGWASIITSAIDPGITYAIPCNPIYSPRTIVAGLGNKRKLYVSYVCGCTNEMDTVFDGERFVGSAKNNAQQMIQRVYNDAIRYSGSLIIDGWNPSQDWIKASTLLGSFDADVMYPTIFIFSATDDLIEALEEDDDTADLANSERIRFSRKSFYDCIEEFIQLQADEEAVDIPSETLTFNLGKRSAFITIPKEAINALGTDSIHILVPKDRAKTAYDAAELRGVTSRFLSTAGDSLPYWPGYQHGCYFKRDIYTTKSGNGLKDLTLAALNSGNLHQTQNMIILHGPSNSGKSVLLGKLASDLSASYPVVFIKGDLPDNLDLAQTKYASLVNFINYYIVSPCREKRINRGRVLVIWDNNAFYDNIQDYIDLKNELSESNAVLVCSAYESIRQTGRRKKYNTKEISYIELSPILSANSEIKALYSMLNTNLGDEYGNALEDIRNQAAQNKYKTEGTDLLINDTRLLSLIQRLFQHDQDKGLYQISLEAQRRTGSEAFGNDDAMRADLLVALKNVTENYDTDIKGLAEIAKLLADPDSKDEDWYKKTVECAPALNDIIAVAGQFKLRLPLDLVLSVLIYFFPDMYYYTDSVLELLQCDTMLETPFPRNEINQVMVGYRSPDEADIYLSKKYNGRPSMLDALVTEDSNGVPFREDREIEILKGIIHCSNLSDYSGTNFYTLKVVKELIDQFGPNSRMGEKFGDKYKYKYDDIASCILENGGDVNPEMALTAAFLSREQILNNLLDCINKGIDTENKDLEILDSAERALSSAIEIELSSGSSNSNRLMRIYVEWCTNRNYTYHRQNPTQKDINLYYQIRERFLSALRIYLQTKDRKMNPNGMLDVYLNAFINYVNALEKLYGIKSFPEYADPVIYEKYTQEISFVMTVIVGKLFDPVHLDSSKTNLNSNLLETYRLAKQPIAQLKARARAVGSGAFILLKARSLWIDESGDSQSTLPRDLYLISDFSRTEKPLPASDISIAKKVYAYLTEKDNLSVIRSFKKHTNTEIGCLEMLIRAAWIAKTGYMPFTLNQRPVLTRDDWDQIHDYCNLYIEHGKDQANYAFAYYFEGMYYWIFTRDLKTKNSGQPSQFFFNYCLQNCYKPRGLNYYSDSFVILCSLGTNSPIVFNAQISKSKYREEATIINAVNTTDVQGMMYIENKANIYYASTLNRGDVNYNASSQITEITIRFNLKGALSGPLPKNEEDYDND